MTEDIHAERRIHELEAQLRKARDDALEEAAKVARSHPNASKTIRGEIANTILSLKGTSA